MESEKVKEIKKALECCAFPVWTKCDKCPRVDEDSLCKYRLRADALTLINELEKENEILRKHNIGYHIANNYETYDQLKQFAERLKEHPTMKIYSLHNACERIPIAIDETLKEFLGE